MTDSRAPSALTAEQQKRLIKSFDQWLERLDRANSSSSGGVSNVLHAFGQGHEPASGRRTKIEHAFDDMFFDSFVVTMALEQINRILDLLKDHLPDDLRAARRHSVRLCDQHKITMLRNLLEHHVNHELGRGNYAKKIVSLEKGPALTFNDGRPGIKSIETFGIVFEVSSVIDAAFSLEQPMRRFRQSLD